MSWTEVGETGVDAGIIIVTDPCYVIRNDGEGRYDPIKSYDQLLEEMERQDEQKGERPLSGATYQLTNEHGAHIGVIVGRFGGDGVFPVYVQRDEQGMTIAVMIRFDDQEPMSLADLFPGKEP